MLLELSVNYEAPSRETLFLESGWGIRDVRGPYLGVPEGLIRINRWALSSRVPSRICLQFEMSNRVILEATAIQAIGDFGRQTCYVSRNRTLDLVIENVLANEAYLIRIVHPAVIESGRFDPGLSDFIAINSLSISR